MINRINYKYQLDYLNFLKNVKSLSDETIKKAKVQINHFLIWMDEKSIDKCYQIQDSYPKFLATNRMNNPTQISSSEVKPLHSDTQKKNIQTIKRFLRYLKIEHPKKFNNLSLHWIESMMPTAQQKTIRKHIYISEEEILKIATYNIPDDNLLLQREQASACMLFASGMRSSAFGSLPIKAVDLENFKIQQDPSLGVRTKNGLASTTTLLNIPEILQPIKLWDQTVRSKLNPDAMWYAPFLTNHFGSKATLSNQLPGKTRNQAIAKGIRKLFATASLDYKSPHKFRHGHAVYSLLRAKDMADYKAISQNLMHGNIKVTDETYAWLNHDDIKNRILNLSNNNANADDMNDELKSFIYKLSKNNLRETIHIATDLLVSA